MKKVNMNFIAQNVAPIDTKQVAIFDSDGSLVATLPLGGLTPKHQGEKNIHSEHYQIYIYHMHNRMLRQISKKL